ncbi:protein FRA10AC1-like [Zingiber officinale]|uniref:protein FRA10AC1-like n=1 Tax=Zingiber officinale TaxID=94328 RepID=UPI001C4A9679|nr:protein FRA10AC1-like [Zingiber officinale]
MTSLRSLKSSIFDKEERKMQYQSHIRGLNAYDRHNKFMKDYVQFYGKTTSCPRDCVPIKTDQDTIREGHRFIISEDDDMESTWEKRLVKRYYDKLFKEYCIADMSHFKEGKIGLRWRMENEVISGKGESGICITFFF